MKILVTGITRLECGLQPQLRYISNAELFVKLLQDGGADVTFAPVMPGDDLTSYDVIFVGLGPFLSITADRLYGALYAIKNAADAGCSLAFYMDDWNFTRTVSNLRTIRNTGIRQLTKQLFSGRHGYDWVVDNQEEVLNLCLKLLEKPWPTTVIPATRWGDHDRFVRDLPSEEVVIVDPSIVAESYHPVPDVEPADKVKRWVLGTLKDERPWLDSLGLRWETRYAGGVASKATEKFKEADLVDLYAHSWGVLSPPHKRILGTGWWRYRFTAARVTGCILLADPGEMPKLAPEFAIKPAMVEQMNTAQLMQVARSQAIVYDRWKMSIDEATDTLMSVMRNARPW